jgi:hypothetical protein
MNHKQVLRSVVVQCPAIPKQLGAAVIGFMNRNHCACADCGDLKRKMGDPPLVAFPLSFAQATTILQGLRINAANCDYALGFADHLCQLLGQAIEQSNEPPSVLHQLEQAHAHTREQVRFDRLRLWFAREFNAHGSTSGERFRRLMNEVCRLLTEKDEFPVTDEHGFRFDRTLRNRVATLADWLAKQIV